MLTRIYSPYAGLGGSAQAAPGSTDDALNRKRKPENPFHDTNQPSKTKAAVTEHAGDSFSAKPVSAGQPFVPAAPPADAFGSSQASAELMEEQPLQTVNLHNQQQTITGKAVFADMRQTAELLGASPELMQQVDSAMKQAESETRQPNPNQDLVNNLLLSTADTLDTHVSDALGTPSSVVREWVEALVKQPVDWKGGLSEEAPEELITPVTASTESAEPASSVTAAPVVPAQISYEELSPADTLRMNGLLAQAKQAYDEKNWPQAHRSLDRALAVVSNAPGHPMTGRLHWLKAKAYGQQGNYQQAVKHADKVENTVQLAPQQFASLRQQQGSWHTRLNKPQAAQAAFQEGLEALSANGLESPKLTQQLQLGLIQSYQAQGAWQASLDALGALPESPEQAALQAQAYWKAGQPQQAERSFRAALTQARESNNHSFYLTTLRHTAAFYLDQDNMEKAQGLLSVWSRLGQA